MSAIEPAGKLLEGRVAVRGSGPGPLIFCEVQLARPPRRQSRLSKNLCSPARDAHQRPPTFLAGKWPFSSKWNVWR